MQPRETDEPFLLRRLRETESAAANVKDPAIRKVYEDFARRYRDAIEKQRETPRRRRSSDLH